MSYTGKSLTRFYEILSTMPEGIYFNTCWDGSSIDFQAKTNKEARTIRSFFPGAKWVRTYTKTTKWWEWNAEWQGSKLRIYGIEETPASCKAITETRTVTKQVPVTFEEREVEETVIVGWDCVGASQAD